MGAYAKGKQLLSGNFLLGGHLIEAPGLSIWDLPEATSGDTPEVTDAAFGFIWLDDLAAVADSRARQKAQDWTFDWIARYGAGDGPGWRPDLTGQRLIRHINHGPMLLNGRPRADADRFFMALGREAAFLARRALAAAPGLGRFNAVCGLVCAGVMLKGLEWHAGPALEALAAECDAHIAPDGAIDSRNPAELLDLLSLLIDTAETIRAAGQTPPPEVLSAISRIAPALRLLRMPDGGLARFQGGGSGTQGRLDAALAASGGRGIADGGIAMGYARLQAATTALVIDAAPPPHRAQDRKAQASTLAFEMTSGRRPLVVGPGPASTFGANWACLARASASQSTLSLEGYSSSRLGVDADGAFAETPANVWMRRDEAPRNQAQFGHDGYVPTHALTHLRDLALSPDGHLLHGIDTLGAMSPVDTKRLETLLVRVGIRGIPYQIRFHLHPDVDATLDMGGWAVSMALKSGEIWVFRFDGEVALSLAPSVWFDTARSKPRPSQQIVLSGRLLEPMHQISWTFEKAQDTPPPIHESDINRPHTDI